MANEPDEAADLAAVCRLLFADHGIVPVRYSKAETRAGRSPDFKIMLADRLVGFSEVKSPRDDWLDEQLEGAEAFEIRGGVRKDPIFNRIGRQIEKAVSQFDAVNANHDLPNVLVFLNHDNASNFNDLEETLTGEFRTTTGERIATVKNVSEGKLKDAKDRIDVFIWIDRKTDRIRLWLAIGSCMLKGKLAAQGATCHPGLGGDMRHRSMSVIAILLASFPAVASAQANCEAVPAGPARTDCFLALSQFYRAQSDLAAAKARAQSDAARYRAITGTDPPKHKPHRWK
jgi:hypothetical protein